MTDNDSVRIVDLAQFACVGDNEGPCKEKVVVTTTGFASHYVTAAEFAPLCELHARLHRENLEYG